MDGVAVFYLVAGALAGGFVNGLAGFGTSLFALGWWLQVMPPLQAVAMVLAMSVATGLQGAWIVRAEIRAARLGLFLVPALVGVPIGLSILAFVDASALRTGIAVFLILYGGFLILRRDLPLVRPMPVIDAVIGFAGGILGALAGLSGALPTMWLALRDWTKTETRAVLQPFNIVVLGLAAVLLALEGAYDRATLIAMATALPFALIAAQLGIWTFRRLPDTAFRRLLVGLMLVCGLILLARELA